MPMGSRPGDEIMRRLAQFYRGDEVTVPEMEGNTAMPPLSSPSPQFLLTVALLGFIEWTWRKSSGLGYDRQGVIATLAIMAGQILIKGLSAGAIGSVLMFAYSWSPISLSLEHPSTWVLGFFAVEFAYYWMHRMSHEVRYLWATHSVHHSPTVLILPVALRLGWTGEITGTWLFYVPLALLGFHPVLIVTLLILNLRFQFFLHTERVGRLGPLEWVFNTPSHHRVHHASNPEYIDKNYGGVLILFDRLFGTFANERSEIEIRYGLTEPPNSHNPLRIVFHEWRRIIRDLRTSESARSAFSTLFGPPRGAHEPARVESSHPPLHAKATQDSKALPR